MKLKHFAMTAALAGVTALASSAHAATAVIKFSGQIDQFIDPTGVNSSWEQTVLEQTFFGEIVIREMERFYQFGGRNSPPTLFDATLTFDGTDGAGLNITSDLIGGIEGQRSLVANPNYDPNLPDCGIRGFNQGSCAPFNSTGIFVFGSDFDGILGEAALEIVDGVPSSFSWSVGEDVMSTFDGFFADRGLDNFLAGASLELSDFTITNLDGTSIDGEYMFYEAGTSHATISAVPIPAAVWMMGSALLGLVGVARRRKA